VNTGVADCPAGGRGTAVPRTCLSRRSLRIHLFRIARSRVRAVIVFVNGRRQRVLRGRRSSVVVSLQRQRRGVMAVRLAVRLRGGRTVVVRRTYHTCAPKRRG
jgi:hypothetical protein